MWCSACSVYLCLTHSIRWQHGRAVVMHACSYAVSGIHPCCHVDLYLYTFQSEEIISITILRHLVKSFLHLPASIKRLVCNVTMNYRPAQGVHCDCTENPAQAIFKGLLYSRPHLALRSTLVSIQQLFCCMYRYNFAHVDTTLHWVSWER